MLIWELKSRYIIMCIPPMVIMAQLGFERCLKSNVKTITD